MTKPTKFEPAATYASGEWGKVLERLATSERIAIVVSRETDGKMRVTSGSWAGEKVFLRGQVLEVRNVDGRPRVPRKTRQDDEWDPPTGVYDHYGPGESNDFGVTADV